MTGKLTHWLTRWLTRAAQEIIVPHRLIMAALATGIMAGVLGAWAPPAEIWIELKALLRATDLAIYILLGASVYGLVVWIAGLRPEQFVRGSS